MTGRSGIAARGALLVTGAFTLVSVAGCGTSAPSVVVSPAAAHTLRYSPGGTGALTAAVDRAVIVERRSTVLDVAVVEGQSVRAGQPLLRVYTIGQSTAVADATNTLRADEKLLPFVKAAFGNVSAKARTFLDRIAHDRLRLTRLKTAPTVLTAPVGGRVVSLMAQPGATINRSQAMLHVVDDSALHVVVPVLAGYRSQLHVGQRAFVSVVSLAGRTFPAVITGVGAVVPARADGTGVTAEDAVAVTVEVANPDKTLTAGSTAYVRLPLTRHAAVAVDSLAVLGQSQPFVFVVRHGIVHQRQVVVGPSDGTLTEIEGGLAAGEHVVISGGDQVVDRSHVNVSGQENP